MRLSRRKFRNWSQPWEDLEPLDWFAALTPAVRRSFSRHADWVNVTPGTRLQQQGVHAGWVWVVASGVLELQRGGEVVGLVLEGAAACEVDVLLGAPSAVDVVAATPATVVAIPSRAFHGLLDTSSFGAAVARRMAGRFETLSARVPETRIRPSAPGCRPSARASGVDSRSPR
jgi:CRP-like cAMP-binding protein